MQGRLKISPFQLDITPPIGAPLAYCPNDEIGAPIYIRGLILDDGPSRAVILACDVIYIWGHTWLEWRKVVAGAAGAGEDRVFLHSVHQHDSVRLTPEWNPFTAPFGRETVDETYCRDTLERLRRRVADASRNGWTTVAKVMTAEKRMRGLASNRRMIGEDGTSFATRFSRCEDPALRAMPVGLIDPLLRTVAFVDDSGQVAAALHFYASHPMSAYLRSKVGPDVPGAALDHVAKTHGSGAFHLYLTGCAGDVAFGKYNTGDPDAAAGVLGRRLGEGMLANLRDLEEAAPGGITCSKAEFDYPLDPTLTEDNLLPRVQSGKDGKPDLRAISRLLILRNREAWSRVAIYGLSLGPDVHLLSLPGEICVEYQLYAQSLVPERFLACAAYGNGTIHYVPTARMFHEGGYEPSASVTTPEVERRLKRAIRELLRPLQ